VQQWASQHRASQYLGRETDALTWRLLCVPDSSSPHCRDLDATLSLLHQKSEAAERGLPVRLSVDYAHWEKPWDQNVTHAATASAESISPWSIQWPASDPRPLQRVWVVDSVEETEQLINAHLISRLQTTALAAVGLVIREGVLALDFDDVVIVILARQMPSLPAALVSLLNRADVLKCGASLEDEVKKFAAAFPAIQPPGESIISFSSNVSAGRAYVRGQTLSAMAMQELQTDVPALKENVANSDWSRCPLTQRQVRYLCMAAWVCYQLGELVLKRGSS
jgi:hypothetical protein